jgi:hypothetical protein
MTQPTALFLADILEDAGKPADIAEKCAAELRRLHAQRDALLEALRDLVEAVEDPEASSLMRLNAARAAIKVAEENT